MIKSAIKTRDLDAYATDRFLPMYISAYFKILMKEHLPSSFLR